MRNIKLATGFCRASMPCPLDVLSIFLPKMCPSYFPLLLEKLRVIHTRKWLPNSCQKWAGGGAGRRRLDLGVAQRTNE
uniref:LD42550p n=1 Tax=Drosophila melanogaster TaxID=7227 RepID=Q95SY5_DROME|nr:LD42550p [Drosophila melanogaster]